MVMTHLIYSNGLATNLPSELVFLALPSNNLCSLVGVVEWAFILSERHTQVTFVVTAASFNVQRVVCTVIRNRATHGFLLNFIMSYYLGHQNKTRVCHCPNMFGVRLQVTICWIDSNNLPNSRKPTQIDYSSTDITFPFWKQTFRPQKSHTGFQRDRITDCKNGLCFEVSSNYQLELYPFQPTVCSWCIGSHARYINKLYGLY